VLVKEYQYGQKTQFLLILSIARLIRAIAPVILSIAPTTKSIAPVILSIALMTNFSGYSIQNNEITALQAGYL